jgi:integrase
MTQPVVVTAKREYGTGGLREVEPGVWELRWRTARDPFTGRRAQRKERFHGSAKAARTLLRQRMEAVEASSTMTLGALRDRWARDVHVTATTMAGYDYALAHLPAPMLTMPASEITSPLVADLYHRLLTEGVGRQTIKKLATALSSMFRFAVERGIVERNPVRGVRPPSIERREYVIPTIEHVWAMVDDADNRGGAWGIWLRLVVGSGARRGEVLALRWGDVSADCTKLRVTKAKTTAGVRTIILDDDTGSSLKAWRAKSIERALSVGVALGDRAYVVSDDEASERPWRLDLATKRFARLAAAVGCPGARLHDVRHAHVTWLLESGVSDRAVADRVGHVRPSFTRDFYGKMMLGRAEEAADTIGRVMRRGTV